MSDSRTNRDRKAERAAKAVAQGKQTMRQARRALKAVK
jgi:hypothetical protein